MAQLPITAEQARAATAAARARIQEENAEKAIIARQKDEDLRREAIKAAASEFWREECRKVIENVQNQGRSTAHLTVAQWREDISDYDRYLSAALRAQLTAEGFTVKEYTDVTEPFGSDPMFYNTVYDLRLEIKW